MPHNLFFTDKVRSITSLFTRLRSALSLSSLRANWLGVLLLVATLLYGATLISHNSFAVSAFDTTGYANLAYSLQHGPIVQTIPLYKELGLPPSYARAFITACYLWVPGTDTMAPFYPVGMPLHMALFSLVLGWQRGLYLVSPVLATLSVWLMYLLGLELGLSRRFAITGAIILAFCPPFVFESLQAMSDVTATFWSLVTILAALRSQKNMRWSGLAGAAFGVAFLVRPTSALLLLPLAFSLRLNWRSLFFFGLGGSPLAIFFFTYNYLLFGHPLHTGYTATATQDGLILTGFIARFIHYVYWLAMSMSPLVLLGWVATPFQRHLSWRLRLMLLTWFGVFFTFYCFYLHYNAWWYMRFLLPGIPALILALMITGERLTEWLTEKFPAPFMRPTLGASVLFLTLGLTLGFEQYLLWRFEVFNFGPGQYGHRTACRWAKQLMPERALVLAIEMSGTWKFYTDRGSIRWDLASAEQLQEIARRATAQGRPLYAFLVANEVAEARQKMAGDWTKIGEYGPFGDISLWRVETLH